MHTKALLALFGLSFAACTGVIDGGTGPGGGGGDDTGPAPGCGDGVKQGAEGCDDGNTISGDGCSASCTAEEVITPHVAATVDKVTLMSALGKTERLTVNFTSEGGFTGPVNLASTVNYGTGNGAWVVTQSKPAAQLTSGGTDSITIDVAIPTDTAALTGTVKLDATGAPDPISLSSTVNVANEYTVVIPANTTAAIPHAYTNSPAVLKLRVGAKLNFKNEDTIAHRIHGNGNVPHEDAGGGQPGSTYAVTIQDGMGSWYCHDHNEDNFSHNLQVVQ